MFRFFEISILKILSFLSKSFKKIQSKKIQNFKKWIFSDLNILAKKNFSIINNSYYSDTIRDKKSRKINGDNCAYSAKYIYFPCKGDLKRKRHIKYIETFTTKITGLFIFDK
jgi:hypothetical protein